MSSLWNENVQFPSFPRLNGKRKTDVLIIGGGLAGILCAYFLKQKGVNYILAEGGKVCSGTTADTTAKITAQHGLIYHKLLKSNGKEQAAMYLKANLTALREYNKLCKDIDCDFEIKDNYVYSLDDLSLLEKEFSALSKIGYKAYLVKNVSLPFKTAGAVKFSNQAQFNPLKFAAAICKDLNILENTFVREIRNNKALTDSGEIEAKKIITATHFPFINKHGSYFLKMYQHRSYEIALKNAPQLNGMYVDESKKGLSFRNYGEYLLVGGGSHRTGKKGGNWTELRNFAARYYPNAKEKYHWAAQDCMSLDGIPYIGHYSKRMRDLYVATGFNKWGMTSSMVSAMLLSDMVIGKKPDWAEVFNPSRSMLKPQLALNAFEATVNLLTPTTKRCPHLGCALKWNSAEHSWDCPCHGSRFSKDGILLENPSTGNLK